MKGMQASTRLFFLSLRVSILFASIKQQNQRELCILRQIRKSRRKKSKYAAGYRDMCIAQPPISTWYTKQKNKS